MCEYECEPGVVFDLMGLNSPLDTVVKLDTVCDVTVVINGRLFYLRRVPVSVDHPDYCHTIAATEFWKNHLV